MSSDCPEVRALLAELTPKVKGCREELNAQAVGNALYGLQGMSSDCPEVRELLVHLLPKIVACTGRLSGQEVGMAIYGLRAIELGADWSGVFRMWIQDLRTICADPNAPLVHVSSPCQFLAFVVGLPCKLASMLESQLLMDDLAQVRGLLARKLDAMVAKDPLGMNRHEERYLKLARAAFKDRPNVTVSAAQLMEGFECDILIHVHSPASALPDGRALQAVVNVELDGPHHKSVLSKKRFCIERDQYMATLGVTLVRDICRYTHSSSCARCCLCTYR
jgi:hypothetical protein